MVKSISQIGHDLDGENIIDCTDLLVTPGFVDLHVHLREPGFEHKGTIKTETLSAKYGGYTHIVAMANTNPCMDDKETIEDFIQRVQKDSSIHTYTYSAITKDLKGQELVVLKKIMLLILYKDFLMMEKVFKVKNEWQKP